MRWCPTQPPPARPAPASPAPASPVPASPVPAGSPLSPGLSLPPSLFLPAGFLLAASFFLAAVFLFSAGAPAPFVLAAAALLQHTAPDELRAPGLPERGRSHSVKLANNPPAAPLKGPRAPSPRAPAPASCPPPPSPMPAEEGVSAPRHVKCTLCRYLQKRWDVSTV